jgi:cupin fold WbuC family metalloprotein
MTVKIFSSEYLNDLVFQAKLSPRLRQHSNIHLEYDDPCQRLFNAIEPESYIRPHCHGVETLFVVQGLMALMVFSEEGDIEQIQRLVPESRASRKDDAVGVEVPSGKWHTVVSLASGSVLLEAKAGPFNPDVPKIFAPWAPAEGSVEGANYLNKLMLKVN